MKVLLLIAALAIASCSTYRPLHKPGSYTISWRKENATKFEGVKGVYILPSDTLNVGDKVDIILITRKKVKREK